jgi:hypothetical protein
MPGETFKNERRPDKTAGVGGFCAWKLCFVLIFLWFVSFHQGKEMNEQGTIGFYIVSN